MAADLRILKEVEIIRNRFYKRGLVFLLLALAISGQMVVKGIQNRVTYDFEESYRVFLSQQLPEETWQYIFSEEITDVDYIIDYLTVYQLLCGLKKGDIPLSGQMGRQLAPEKLEELKSAIRQDCPQEYELFYCYNELIWTNLTEPFVFPVEEVKGRPEADYSFEDSWNSPRTYGGERTHEGTDIMASVNERGIYPICSIGDGVVEKMGWLPQGGYRIGVRSENGVYFYYAHLAEYADLCEGDYVESGSLLGMMGDTGYSEIPGTTGNFPVHLHFGIYLNDESGAEFAVNSYPFLRYLLWRSSR